MVTDAADSPLQWLYAALDFGAGDRIDAAQLSTGLRRLGELHSICPAHVTLVVVL